MTLNSEFAHPEYLVDAEWVDMHKGDPNVIVVDTDVEAGYIRGHIPGSVMVPDNYEKDPDTGRTHIMNRNNLHLCVRVSGLVITRL